MTYRIQSNTFISVNANTDIEFNVGNIDIVTTYTGNLIANANPFLAATQLPVGLIFSEAAFQGTVAGYVTGSSGYIPASFCKIQKYSFTNENILQGVGNLSQDRVSTGHASNEHGYNAGGACYPTGTPAYTSTVDRFPFSSLASATNVGSICVALAYGAAHSSSTNGYLSGGYTHPPATYRNTLQRFTFASTVSCCNIGTISCARLGLAGISSSINGYSTAGNWGPGNLSLIDKFPFSTDTSAICIGSLSCARNYVTGQSSSTHGYTSGGGAGVSLSIIEKFPFASETCITSGGSLAQARFAAAGISSTNNGYTVAGNLSPGYSSKIDRFPFAADSAATIVGDLGFNTQLLAGISD